MPEPGFVDTRAPFRGKASCIRELLVVGGTFRWRLFKVHIYRQDIKPTTKTLTLYFEHAWIGRGELGINEVSLTPVEPMPCRAPARPGKPVRSRAPAYTWRVD